MTEYETIVLALTNTLNEPKSRAMTSWAVKEILVRMSGLTGFREGIDADALIKTALDIHKGSLNGTSKVEVYDAASTPTRRALAVDLESVLRSSHAVTRNCQHVRGTINTRHCGKCGEPMPK